MTWLNNLKVGDVVYFVHSDSRYQQSNKDVMVETKGRKWVKLSNNERVDITQKHDIYAICQHTIGKGNIIYKSEYDYREIVRMNELMGKIRDELKYGSVNNDQIIAISRILGVDTE